MKFKYIKKFHLFLVAINLILFLFLSIPLKIAIARHQAPIPQAILTLGGGVDREIFTARLAQSYPKIPIWISSGTEETWSRKVFREANISPLRIYLDRRATDTVTNFTSLVEDFKKQHIKHLFLITSDFHLPRAKAIAFVVLGSHGITFTSVSVPSNHSSESWLIIIRDAGRALFWIITGHTGASLKVFEF